MKLGKSVTVGKDAIKVGIQTHFNANSKILDMGAGAGTYADLLQDSNYIIDAVEVFEPAIPHIINKYRKIYCMDLKYFKFLENYDLVIMGDVLEHLTVEDAQFVLKNVLQHCKTVLVAVPFGLTQPGDENPYEEHKQPELHFNLMQERYPQLELLLFYYTDKYLFRIDNGQPYWLQYAYYIGKGEE